MRTPSRFIAALGLVIAALVAPARADGVAVDIPYEQFTLPNGLRVLVHTDRKVPIVAVNIWYHVGSKNEAVGRSGFAHLFEHLMFQGSEHFKGEYFEPFERIGATDQNGTTNEDRTNYFENVPTTALDVALWMESDRMGHLLGALDQATLEEQRGVVQNEKRTGENQPYGQSYQLVLEHIYPAAHPYHHDTIGSMTDLNAAKLDDVKAWFRSWYGPNNAVLVLAGDIDVATAKTKVTRYFGDIAPSATLPKVAPRIPVRTTATRARVTDAVPQTRIIKVWGTPQFGTVASAHLAMLSHILVDSQSSRLRRRLKFAEPLADAIESLVGPSEIAGLLWVQVDVKPGVDPAKVKAAIDDEVGKLVARGPTAEEVAQARATLQARLVRGVERIGGFGGKADVLAECLVYLGDPTCYRAALARFAAATPAALTATAARWLRRGAFTLQIDPGERAPLPDAPAVANLAPVRVPPAPANLKALPSTLDRGLGVPIPDAFPSLLFPAVTRATLSNGLRVVLAERRGLPLVELSLELQGAGFSSDRVGKLGAAAFTVGMLDEGAGNYDALAFAARKESLGAQLSLSTTIDLAILRLSALKPQLDDSLALLADTILRPRLAAADLERVRGTWLASIKQEQASPSDLIRRLAGPALYGPGHPYAVPFTGTGTATDVAALTRDDLTRWLTEHVRPDSATLIVVGDTDLTELTPKLERVFAGWRAPATPLAPHVLPAVKPPVKPRVLLADQPGSIQASIFVGSIVPSSLDPAAIDLELADSLLGGNFTSRLNLNLRENKHWSYYAASSVEHAIGPRMWSAGAAVQIDKTAESAQEMRREVVDYITAKSPATADELAKMRGYEVRRLPGSYETADAVLTTLSEIALYHRPDDYPARRAARIGALTLDQLKTALRVIQPAALTWIIVGDLKKIEAPIRALGLGTVQVVDPDGRVLR